MTTLSYLVGAVRGDDEAAAISAVSLRSLAGQVSQPARSAHAPVRLRPAPDVRIRASPVLRRVPINVVDNAAPPAGPAGRAGITVAMLAQPPPRLVIEVPDDGPGSGNQPPGAAALGLGVVTTPAGPT
jgi:hypothetical protein